MITTRDFQRARRTARAAEHAICGMGWHKARKCSGGDRIKITGQGHARPDRGARRCQAHHVVHIQNVNAQCGDARQQVRAIAANVQAYQRAGVMYCTDQVLLTRQYQPCIQGRRHLAADRVTDADGVRARLNLRNGKTDGV